MAIFDYRAKDQTGNTVSGVVESPSIAVATEILEDRRLIILSVKERKKSVLFQSSIGFLNRVPMREVVIFSRQLAVMISTSVPIVQALRILVKQTSNINFKIIISNLADEVDGGAKLSQSLGRYPQVYSDFYVNMVRSGETTGKLDEILVYLADQVEKDYDLTRRIRGAFIYPAFILLSLVGVGTVMMVYVIPQLTAILQESGQALPFSTRLLIGVSNFITHQWYVVILLLVGLVVGYVYAGRTVAGRKFLDRWKLKVPVFGKMFTKIYLTRFCRSIATLIAGGIPLTKTLEITADVIGNVTYKDITLRTIKVIEDGSSIATVFAQESKVVPPMLSQMMAVGEQTGRLDIILGKLGDFFNKEVEVTVTNMVSLLEPFIMIVMGVAVGVMVTAIMVPLYNLSNAI